MSARDEILARVRAATAGVEAPARPSLGGSRPVSVDLFAERVADYRAVVERCTPEQLAERVAAAVAGRVVVPAGLGVEVADAIADHGLSAAELDRIDTVVTEARVGIAETGTIVLDHGPGQGRRALTLVPDRHVCIVRADQVVADVQDAVALLDPARPLTWISGPSATSDIELDRVEGVHGPRNLHVLVVAGHRVDEFGISRGSVQVQEHDDEEVSTMAATIDIEIESGVFTGPVRQHRGYYAGDFSARAQGESD